MYPPVDETATQPMPDDVDNSGSPQKEEVDPKTKKRWAMIRQQADVCKTYKRKLIRNWSINIDYRRGKTFASQTDDNTTAVNIDWPYTKTKHAALFSQIPKIHIVHSPESVTMPWVPVYERAVNDTLVKAGLESAMDEVMPDCINAAGFGAVLVSHEALLAEKQLPQVDIALLPPEVQKNILATGKFNGAEVPMTTMSSPVDARYVVRRISPADFLWPVDFSGSDFDKAPWLGYTGRLTWEEAKSRFRLTDEDKEEAIGNEQTVEDRLSHDYDREHAANDGKVGFDELFIHKYQYESDAQSFSAIRHMVFLHGKAEPCIDEDWVGQKLNEQTNKLIGAMGKPIRVLTLTYVTDEDIPPSDSAIGRPQVNELNKGRLHIVKQRARSTPATWFDVNRIDPTIQTALMRGVWNHAIPVQGDGSRVIGTIEQPVLAQENYMFDRTAKSDLQESWAIGTNQAGTGEGIETKGEANVVQSNYNTKITRERARVASFVCGIAKVLAGLMCVFEDPAMFGQGFDPSISDRLDYSILPDATVILDSNQRLQQLNNYLNNYAKLGWVNIEPVLKEITTLVGLDPNSVVVKPSPKQPDMPNISLRLTGGQDMMNPLLLAFMLKSGLAPDEQLVEQAKQLIQKSVIASEALPQAPAGQMPQPLPPKLGDANPEAAALPKINQRTDNPAPPPVGAR